MTALTIIPLFLAGVAGYFASEALRAHQEYRELVKKHERNEILRALKEGPRR